jgi:hypothetical protein
VSFRSSSVSSMIMASIPIPAITAKCSGARSSTVIFTRSIWRTCPAKGDLDGVEFLEWQIEVSSQQVAGAGRYQSQRNPGVGQTVGNVADCAVASCTDDKINVLCDSLFGPGAAWVLGRGFQPQRVAPAVSLEAFLHEGVKLVADLGRVVDDRATPADCWRSVHQVLLFPLAGRSPVWMTVRAMVRSFT